MSRPGTTRGTRRPGRPKGYERAVALERAVDAFWSRGYSATSVRDLVHATGLAPKSLYSEFGGKEGVFVAAIDAYATTHSGRYRLHLGSEPLGVERIQGYYEGLDVLSDRRGCFLVNSLGEFEVIPSAAVRRIQSFFRWLTGLYCANLEAAARGGGLKGSPDMQELARALVVFDQGLAIASRSTSMRRHLASAATQLLRSIRA